MEVELEPLPRQRRHQIFCLTASTSNNSSQDTAESNIGEEDHIAGPLHNPIFCLTGHGSLDLNDEPIFSIDGDRHRFADENKAFVSWQELQCNL